LYRRRYDLADALAEPLNPAQDRTQSEADRRFQDLVDDHAHDTPGRLTDVPGDVLFALGDQLPLGRLVEHSQNRARHRMADLLGDRDAEIADEHRQLRSQLAGLGLLLQSCDQIALVRLE